MDNKVSALIQQQVPDFIKSDYQTFISFLEAYYEFMEQDYDYDAFAASTDPNKKITDFPATDTLSALSLGRQLLKHQDVDTTIDVFFEHFQREYLTNMPRVFYNDGTSEVNKKTLMKNIRQFYRARGTEKSFQLLFRLLYNTGLDIYYPSKDMLRTSDGKWIRTKIMRVFQLTGDTLDLKNRRIVGQTSQAEIYVDTVTKFQFGVYTVYELTLFTDTLIGEFQSGETIKAMPTVEDETVPDITAQIYPIISSLEIQSIGGFVSEGSVITISGDGIGAEARVTKIIPQMLSLEYTTGSFSENEVIIQRISGSETTMASVTTRARCLTTGTDNIRFKNVVGAFETSKTIYGISSGATGYINEIRGPVVSVELTNPGINYTTAIGAV